MNQDTHQIKFTDKYACRNPKDGMWYLFRKMQYFWKILDTTPFESKEALLESINKGVK